MDGGNGMCYEHTASEGIAVVAATLNIFEYIKCFNSEEPSSNLEGNCSNATTKLEFKLTEELKAKIEIAGIHLDHLDADTDDEVFTYNQFGKSFIKTCNCSPDAFIQMSLQLAYFRLNGTLCPTYESASTRRFHFGRVDSIRASHPGM